MWPQIIWMVVTVVVSVAVSLLMGRGQQNRTVSQDMEAPSVDYGTPVKIVLGTRDVKPIYVWFGDTSKQAIKK